MNQPTPRQLIGQKVRRSQFIGAGSLVQLAGIVLLFLFPIGTVAGVILLILGARMSRRWHCGLCGARLEHRRVVICPGCRCRFTN